MGHVACLSVPAPGHVNPMAALARVLVARGHRVTFVHVLDAGPMVRSLGFDFVQAAGADGDGDLQAVIRAAGRAGGLGVFGLSRHWVASTRRLCERLPDLLRELAVDLMLVDQLEPAGGLVARHLNLPFVSVAAALPMNWEVGIPSPFVGWSYGETRWHRARNIASAFAQSIATRPLLEATSRFARAWRLPHRLHYHDYLSGYAQLSQLTPSLDFPRRSLTRCFHYCGPLRDATDADAAPHVRGAGPRAFASLGTLQGHRFGLFHDIARAAAAESLDLTIAHGGRLTEDEVARLAPFAEVHDFVQQDAVLATCEVAVLHGGLNTVLDALARGVPVVVAPIAFEQTAIASRVARAGAGIVCKGRVLRRTRLARAIRTVRTSPRFAAAAARIADEIRASGGATRGADIVEQVLDTGRPALGH